MAKRKPPLPTPDFDPSRIIWPVTLAGLHEALKDILTPAQKAMRAARKQKLPSIAQYYATAAGITADKIKKIDDSGMLNTQEDEHTEHVVLDPALTATMRQVLEATTKTGHARFCEGHPATDRRKDGTTQGVVCFNCHPPSAWPGSPERVAEDVKAEKLYEWTLGALESVVYVLECLEEQEPKNAKTWAVGMAIGVDKVIDGTKRHIASQSFQRILRQQFIRLAYQVKGETPGTVAQWLAEGGMTLEGDAIMRAVGCLALAVEARSLRMKDIHRDTMAAVSLVLRPPLKVRAA
jgi:hypothetical protein